LPSTWWCSSWSVSVGVLFFDLFCGGIVSCFFGWNTVDANVRGSEKSDRVPEHRSSEYWSHKSRKLWKRRQGISKSIHSPQKLWIPLHVPSRPLL
jgi:hypothetical protein